MSRADSSMSRADSSMSRADSSMSRADSSMSRADSSMSRSMPRTDASNCCSAVWMGLRFWLCVIRRFYVRAVIILVCTLLICTSWAEFKESTPIAFYCYALIACSAFSFIQKGFCAGKRAKARIWKEKRDKEQRQLLDRTKPIGFHQAVQEQQQRTVHRAREALRAVQQAGQDEIVVVHQAEGQMAAHPEGQMAAHPEGQMAAHPEGQRPTAAAPGEIHPPNVPSPGDYEPPNVPLQPAESVPTRNVPQSTAGPSTQFPHRPMDVRNDAQIVPSQGTDPLVSNLPQSGSVPSIRSIRSVSSDLTSEGIRSDNLPQSSTDPSSPSTSSASAHEERRFDESVQAAGSDLGHNVPQSSTDPSSPSTSSASAHEERRFNESLQAVGSDLDRNEPQSNPDSSSESN